MDMLPVLPPRPDGPRRSFRIHLAASAIVLGALLMESPNAHAGDPSGSIPTWTTPVSFGTNAQGQATTKLANIGNLGTVKYRLLGWTSTNPEFSVVTPMPAYVHPGSGSLSLEYRYARTGNGPDTGTIHLLTDVPEQPSLAVAMEGYSLGPQAHGELTAASLDFGALPAHGSAERTIGITSTGNIPLEVASVSSTSGRLSAPASFPLSIPPPNARFLQIRLDAGVAGSFRDTLRIQSNDFDAPVFEIPIVAEVVAPPEFLLAPGSLAPVLIPVGVEDSRTLQVSNAGSAWPLTFTSTVHLDSVVVSPGTPPGVPAGPHQERVDGEGRRWSLRPDGAVEEGDPGAFLTGADWAVFPDVTETLVEDGGRTIRYGPSLHLDHWFLTREVFVSPSEGWIRYLETVRNGSNVAGTFRVRLASQLDLSLGWTIRSSALPHTFSGADDWCVVADETGPAVGHVVAGDPAALRPAYVQADGTGLVHYEFDLELAPGESGSILHYVLQAPTLELAMERASALRTPDAVALQGLGLVEGTRVRNFVLPSGIRPSIAGATLAPLSSLEFDLTFDGIRAAGHERVYATLHLASDDPFRPLTSVPLEMRLSGEDPNLVDAGAGAALALAARFTPNPAAGRSLRLSYVLPAAGDASFELFDARGRRIDAHVLPDAAAGPGSIDWARASGPALAPGVYWTRVKHAGKTIRAKGVVLR